MRPWLATLALLAVALPHSADARQRRGIRADANPSALIATELAFAREAREKGQWTAFRDYAADNAIRFVPGQVAAKEWLKKQANPAQAIN